MADASLPAQPTERSFGEGAVERMVGALGARLFEFVVNSSVDSIVEGSAAPEAMAVAHEIDDSLLTQHEGETNPDAWAEVLKRQLTDPSLQGGPLALELRARCGGNDELPEAADEVESLFVGIAARTYPSLLLPPNRHFPEIPVFTSRPLITGTLDRDPSSKTFQEKVLIDPVFAKVYAYEIEPTGRMGRIYNSTGRGGSIQLWTLAEQIIQAAWAENPTATLREFVGNALEQYRFTKTAFSGKEQTVKARMSFAGVLMPKGTSYSFGDVTLRAATQDDFDKAPESLSGQLSATHEHDERVVISYAGDVVAEVDIPYLVRVSTESLGDPPPEFPQDILARNPLESIGTRLRSALLLAMDRPYRVQIVPSWQSTNDPLHYGSIVISWATQEAFVGLTPAQLNEEDMEAWKEWYNLLSAAGAERIQLAISRVVRASAERRDPVDVLIDSVIAWENLFGTKDGEPTLRVTASLALLLEPDSRKRREFRTKLAKIYRLRSDAVHGTAMPLHDDISLCVEALDVAIKALRVVLRDRADLLVEGDGGVRSLKMILGELPTSA